MTVSPKDIKKLWGLAARRYGKPGCNTECVRFLSADDPTVIGEMAHVIGQSPDGPRGDGKGGDDTYENLILLCPTHHTEVDKALEGVFTVEMLHEWKNLHEQRVRTAFDEQRFSNLPEVCAEIERLLIENQAVWAEFGPESDSATKNPISNLQEYWSLRKLDTLVPNNIRIANLIKNHKAMFSGQEYAACIRFCNHADAFERNCYNRTENTPRFPVQFETLIKKYV